MLWISSRVLPNRRSPVDKFVKASALFALLVLAACDRPPALRMDGVGQARVGMPLAQAQTSLGLTLPQGVEPNSCFFAASQTYPGVYAMLEGGALQRLDVREGTMETDTGLGVGDAASKVRDVYGAQVEVLPHKYDTSPGAQYLTVYSVDKRYALRFITAQGKIAGIQSGNAEPVQYVEGCG